MKTTTTPTPYFLDGINAGAYGRFNEAARLLTQGHEKGDAECTALLAYLYHDGNGVARDYNEFYRLAKLLEERHCPLSNCLLACAYSDGLGCEVNKELSEQYYASWAKESAAPIPGISEECRLRLRSSGLTSALEQSHEYMSQNSGYTPLIQPKLAAEEYAQYSSAADAWFIAMSCAHECTPEHLQKLEEAYRNGMSGAGVILGVAQLRDCKENEEDKLQNALSLIDNADNDNNELCILLSKMQFLPDAEGEKLQELYARAVRTMQYGPSGIPRADELPCTVSIIPNSFANVYYIRDLDTTKKLINEDRSEEIFLPVSLPIIDVTYTGEKPLTDCTLRIVYEGQLKEYTTPLKGVLEPNVPFELDINHYAVETGNDIRVEIHAADGRYLSVRLEKGFLDEFCPKSPRFQLFSTDSAIVVVPREPRINSLQFMTTENQKIAEICQLKDGESVAVDLWHIKQAMVDSRTDCFLVQADDGTPCICHLK
ncbi:MAG: sel1 repeat family protein [Akkermansia sp.]|nr:sel1 repeat family protein [Akkermansia sp.]